MGFARVKSPDGAIGRCLVGARTLLEIVLLGMVGRLPTGLSPLLRAVSPRYSMLSVARLCQLFRLRRLVDLEGLPGDIVECGVWNGGSAAVLAAAARARRRVWLFDTFDGNPPPGEGDGSWERRNYYAGFLKGSPAAVREIFDRLGLGDVDPRLVPGPFETTLPGEVERVALLHIDANWYASVRTALERLYPKVVAGGLIVFDDYARWSGCRRAALEFLADRGLSPRCLVRGAHAAAYFRKPADP